MSQPKVWTGSQWKDAQFNVGSSWSPTWKSYKARITETPEQYYFNSNNEGWLWNLDPMAPNWQPAAWGGGAINARTNNPGIMSSVYLASGYSGGSKNGWIPGQRVVCRYTWSSAQEGSANPPVKLYFDRPFSGNDQVEFPTSNNGVQTYTTTSDKTTDTGFFYPSLGISLNDANLAAGNLTRLYLYDAVVLDANTGQPLVRVVQEQWEPKVWSGSAWV